MKLEHQLKYRPEIDGLRAIAVIPVILFHAGIPGFGGGFLGVDVFFVISGYLIASIILAELAEGRFSLVRFYERRARRILPALFLVVFACIPFAAVLLLPSLLKAFSESVAYVSMSASNFLFWKESGYFDPEAASVPLLHTWSLAVEEQFYIVFPVLLIVLHRKTPRFRNAILTAMLLVSLAICVWASRAAPTANFYLMPGRAWELLTGVGCAILLINRATVRIDGKLRAALSLGGLAAVGLSMIILGADYRLPGLLSLVPVLGTALVILFASGGTPAAWLLSMPVLVGIGLVSYSAYLWHYPIFVFARFILGNDPTPPQYLALIAVTFGLAYLSWRFVELPFRDRSRTSPRFVLGFSSAGVLLFLVSGALVASTDGLAVQRFGPEAVKFVQQYSAMKPGYAARQPGGNKRYKGRRCNFYDGDKHGARPNIDAECTDAPPGKKIVFIWGDSHMQTLSSGIRHLFEPAGWFVAAVSASACNPALTDSEASMHGACAASDRYALAEIARLKPQLVLLAQRKEHDKTDWDELAGRLRALGAERVVLFGPVPQWMQSLPELVAYRHYLSRTRLGMVDPRLFEVDRIMKERDKASSNFEYLSILDELCNSDGCLFKVPDAGALNLMAIDYGHLSGAGSDFVVSRLRNRLLPDR